jgi:transposase-like protein
MIRIVLSVQEQAQLERTRHTRPQLAERCHYVLLNAQGWSVPQIARRLDRNEHTIRTWLKAYRTAGLTGLYNTPQTGASCHPWAACLYTDRAALSPRSQPLRLY